MLCLFFFILCRSIVGLNLLELCQSGIRDDGSNYVHCARKSLTEIPSFSSHRFFNLAFDELILSDNLISHIQSNAFSGLKIKRLIMSGNRLKSIDQNAFRELANYLEQLTLEFDGSIVDTIPSAILTNLANIRSLTLIGLNLRHLSSNIFQEMKKLESFTLKSCRLQQIDFDAFHSIEKQLKHLNLDYNQLDQQISTSISRLSSLETLSLSHNRIEQFDTTFVNRNLRCLDLSYNSLMKLTLTNLTNLQILNVQNNLLTSEQIFGSISNELKEFILDFNSIRTLKNDFIGEENSLETFSIQSNDFLLNDTKIFQRFHRLKRLNLARNNIQSIPSAFFNVTRRLENLNLDRNPFLPLPMSTFAGLESSLKNFSCQSCSLTSISLPAFSPLNELQRLKLSSNHLTEFSLSMKNLISLDLQRNQLTQIPSSLPSTLRELELANNQLTQLKFSTLSQLITLDLTSNPLHCDCQIQSVYQWLLKHYQSELVPYVQWICSSPSKFIGKKLGSLKENDLICESTTTNAVEITTESIPSFNVWLKDAETAILEWSRISLPMKLIVYENNYKLPLLVLNSTENYFLLEKLKSSTNYSLCLQTDFHYLCRSLLTPHKGEEKLLSLSSSEKNSMLNDIQYLITGVACGIFLVLLILLFVVVFFIRQRMKFHQSSKTISTDSYYQTTGSDTTQIGGSSSLEEQISRTTPIFYYCRSSTTSNSCPEQQPYHFYHEIPFTSNSSACLCRPPAILI